MSDKHLFRGKRIDNGKWVEGCHIFLCTDDERAEIKHFIIPVGREVGLCCAIGSMMVEVDPTTVCQYTGLTNKNGQKIWENDIVEIIGEDEHCKIEWDEDSAKYTLIQCESVMYDFDNYWGSDLEVIGNVFDNKELLEV